MTERQENTGADWPSGLAKPALRALANAGIGNLNELSRISEGELRRMHGIGPNAVAKLRAAMEASGLRFKS